MPVRSVFARVDGRFEEVLTSEASSYRHWDVTVHLSPTVFGGGLRPSVNHTSLLKSHSYQPL